MIYKIIRLNFIGNARFGSGILETSMLRITADSVFSAICCELAKSGKKEYIPQLVSLVRRGEIKLSDTFPFKGDQLYLPRPFVSVKAETDDGDSIKKKAFRKLKYIPIAKYEAFLKGHFTFEECQDTLRDISEASDFSVYMQVAVRTNDDPEPYSVGKVKFSDDSGLWFLLAASDETKLNELIKVIDSLGYTGIGGKRSSGCGRFKVQLIDVPDYLHDRLNSQDGPFVSLSVCLPRKEELEKAVENASYSIAKKSGFVYSEDYSSSPKKKNDIYVFESGSCFMNSFSGDVYDVASDGNHSVYRYAVPMFISIGGKV